MSVDLFKKYIIKVYDRSGQKFITTLTDFEFESIEKKINSGLGELSFQYAKKFDDFDEETVIKHNNTIKVFVIDRDTGSDGKLLYSGYINSYQPLIDGNKEGVTVKSWGYISKLANAILKNGTQIELKTDSVSGLTTGNVATDTTLDKIFKAIIDRYQAESTNPTISYRSGDIEPTTEYIRYVLSSVTYLDAINRISAFASSDWYWVAGADNYFKFKKRSQTADHTFTLGVDFKRVEVEKNTKGIVNRLLLDSGTSTGSKIIKYFEDINSSDLYDEQWQVASDSNMSAQETVDQLGNAIIAKNKNPKILTKVTILDNYGGTGYDIESIEPGDTCKFKGFNDITSKTFTDNMTIVSVKLYKDRAELELEELSDSVPRDTVKLEKRVSSLENSSLPKKYDTVIEDPYRWHYIGQTGEPEFQNGWTSYGGDWVPARFMKDQNGFVHLEAIIKWGNPTSTMFVLPAGFRPNFLVPFVVYQQDGPNKLIAMGKVYPDGRVFLAPEASAGNNWILLNVTFRAEN